MKSRLLLIWFLLILILSHSEGAQIIRGRVCHVDSRPIEGVRVVLSPSGRRSYTLAGGYFNLTKPTDLPVKKGILIFYKEGFYTNSIPLQKYLNRKQKTVFLVPVEYLSDEISISALNSEEKKIDVPLAENSVSRIEIKEKLPSNLIETLEDTPGVHFIGQGGFQATPTIRGMGRRRVLVLLDGARITSDRRAGTSASFIPPLFMNRVEVVRSASAVIYGSDAISGIINIKTGPEDLFRNSFSLSFNSNDQRIDTGLIFGKKINKINLFTGLNFSQADDYLSPDVKISHSGFQNFSGIFEFSLNDEKRDFSLSYFGAKGSDIGKPNRGNQSDTFQIYPIEENHFFRFNFLEKRLISGGDLRLFAYLNPSIIKLQKINEGLDQVKTADTKSLNFGFKTNVKMKVNKNFSYQIGVEFYGRSGLTIKNILTEGSNSEASTPLNSGERSDLGLFLTADFSGIKNLDILAGMRYTFFNLSAGSGGEIKEKSDSAPSVFLALNKKFSKNFSVFLNLGKAFRVPSLTESYYSGLSGRRFVIGNENLHSESSFNVDGGFKIYSRNMFMGFYGFVLSITDMIERYHRGEGLYTYGNVKRGRVGGVELEFQFFPWQNLEFFGHCSYYRGVSQDTKDPLNDVLSPRIVIGLKHIYKKFWIEGNYQHSFKKDDPGPAEIQNEAYSLINLKAGYYLSSGIFLFFRIKNLLNSSYYANFDPDIPLSPGFSVISGIQLNI